MEYMVTNMLGCTEGAGLMLGVVEKYHHLGRHEKHYYNVTKRYIHAQSQNLQEGRNSLYECVLEYGCLDLRVRRQRSQCLSCCQAGGGSRSLGWPTSIDRATEQGYGITGSLQQLDNQQACRRCRLGGMEVASTNCCASETNRFNLKTPTMAKGLAYKHPTGCGTKYSIKGVPAAI